jgi:hypothetical protein
VTKLPLPFSMATCIVLQDAALADTSRQKANLLPAQDQLDVFTGSLKISDGKFKEFLNLYKLVESS